jgi:glycosyltransferase involved in cell wall biosynthesis
MKAKFAISVVGRFHAFDVARELAKKDSLGTLFTTYPRFAAERFGVPRDLVQPLARYELLSRAIAKLNLTAPIISWDPDFFISNRFDKTVSGQIHEGTNVFIGWASKCLQSLRRAKQLGIYAVVDRGSAHCDVVNELLCEEEAVCGEKLPKPDGRFRGIEIAEYETSDYILIPSSFVRRGFESRGIPPGKLIQIPYGVSLTEFNYKPEKDGVFRIVYAGGIKYQKGVHYLLRAFSELRLPKAELWLVGKVDPIFAPFLKRYEGCYRHIPHVPQRELSQIYNRCSVFAICSLQEGMALVQAQAMACGLPLICTTNSGGEDLIGDSGSGFVLPIRDVEALKEKILTLYREPQLCQQMGVNAKTAMAESNSWANYAEKLTSTFTALLMQSPTRSERPPKMSC